LIIQNISGFSELNIFNISGQEIHNEKISGAVCIINTAAFKQGLYILRLTGKSRNNVVRKFAKK